MHYHLEVVMPPTDNVELALQTILAPFDENANEEGGKAERFWDWYQIGGRYAGTKFLAQFDEKKIDKFYEWMNAEHITISSLQFGKPTLNPSEQAEKVNAKWNEMFPSDKVLPCPLFSTATTKNMPNDIMRLGDVPDRLTAARVIVAAPSFVYNEEIKDGKFTGELEADYMISDSFYNGVTWLDTKWDGKLSTALKEQKETHCNASADYISTHIPTDDWLVVTVDYHS